MTRGILLIALLLVVTGAAQAFDQQHSTWNQLLQRHVHWDSKGVASQVDYAAIQREQAQLDHYLTELSAVTPADYAGWQKAQQLAFLINAYNAFTVKLILSRYPDLQSIKELGSFFSSPWKKKFFALLGQQRSLDEVEHSLIRQPGVFDEPRIHVAVVCASIGCPALRNEAFVAEKLEQQLEDSLRRFLADRSRNRYNASADRLEVSKIFDWYGDDFIGYRGRPSLVAFLADYGELFGADPNTRKRLQKGLVALDYLAYDWNLNDLRR